MILSSDAQLGNEGKEVRGGRKIKDLVLHNCKVYWYINL